MALNFCDGFDSYAATADLLNKWASNTGWSWVSNGGRNGGGCIQATSAVSLMMFSGRIPSVTSMGMGFWMKASAAPAADTTIINLIDTAGSFGGQLVITTAGNLRLRNAASTTRLTSTATITNNIYHWIELQWAPQTNGTNKLYVDNTIDWNSASTANGTASATIDHLQFLGMASTTLTLDDIIIFDSNGAAPLISGIPFNSQEIVPLRPNGDATVQFTPDTGSTNYSRLNEVNSDGDTSYVQDGTSGHQDLYDFDNLSISPANIMAVMANANLENPNPGVINFQQIAKSSATQSDGTSTITPASYRVMQQPFPTDPNTGAAWTPTNLNAARFGVKIP